jgi:uncharacterized protein YbaR (Trm112 family)
MGLSINIHMPIIICPRCRRRLSHNKYDNDVQHKCNSGNRVLDNELVRKVGDYEDEATGEIKRVPNAAWQGSANRLGLTKAGIESGAEFSTLIVTKDQAEKASTHRERQHFEHIELRGNS